MSAPPAPPDRIDPAALAAHYQRFRVSERVLLTGHSHQAWPDVAALGVMEAFDDAAAHVDDKWSRAFAKADRVRRGFGALLGEPDGDIALGASTHDLLVRFLSALPLATRPRLVTTDAEFHTVRRQLARLGEAGMTIATVPATPAATVGERIAAAIDDHTAAAIVSAVFYTNGHVAGGLATACEAAVRHGAELLVDVYHALGVLPFGLAGLERAFIAGGGYKYLQLGEGNCFLRAPPAPAIADPLRPIVTGWFADFAGLEAPPPARLAYATTPGSRFAGATYDPTSHYRAARVFDFFAAQNLTPERLRASNRRQLAILDGALAAADLDPAQLARDASVPLSELGGFLALTTPHASELEAALRRHHIYVDHRGDRLRLGPAPYVTDAQLALAVDALRTILSDRARP